MTEGVTEGVLEIVGDTETLCVTEGVTEGVVEIVGDIETLGVVDTKTLGVTVTETLGVPETEMLGERDTETLGVVETETVAVMEVEDDTIGDADCIGDEDMDVDVRGLVVLDTDGEEAVVKVLGTVETEGKPVMLGVVVFDVEAKEDVEGEKVPDADMRVLESTEVYGDEDDCGDA